MTAPTDAGLRPVEGLDADLEHLAHLAAAVLNTHVNDHGLCAACTGVVFPCESAVLAEHNAALL